MTDNPESPNPDALREQTDQLATSGQNPPKDSRAGGSAIAALVLGILSVSCPPLGIAAWIVGQIERSAIRKGRSPAVGWGVATTGWVLGIIFTVLTALAALLFIGLLSLGLIAGMEDLSTFDGGGGEFFEDF